MKMRVASGGIQTHDTLYSGQMLYHKIVVDNYIIVRPTCTCLSRINIKGGEVHQWYMPFGQQCSNSVIKLCFQYKL